MEVFKRVISTSWLDLSGTYYNNSVLFVFYSIYNRHFLPQGGEPILPHLGCCGETRWNTTALFAAPTSCGNLDS